MALNRSRVGRLFPYISKARPADVIIFLCLVVGGNFS